MWGHAMPRSSENAGQYPATDSSSQPEVLNGKPSPIHRREFLVSTAAGAAALAWPRHGGRAERPGVVARRDDDLSAIRAKVATDGQPGIFATLDAGAPKTLGLYFMYDVKQVDPTEWSSPPWDAALDEKPGLGKVLVGRGAVNQKGPEASLLAALHAIRGAGRKSPVNFVLIAEGEEEIGSPHFPQIVRRPEVVAALKRCVGIFMPSASQAPDGQVTMTLGAKGVVELELVSSGERWGRGPRLDIHSSNKARVDSPAWHLVEALATLVSPDGNDPAIEGFA